MSVYLSFFCTVFLLTYGLLAHYMQQRLVKQRVRLLSLNDPVTTSHDKPDPVVRRKLKESMDKYRSRLKRALSTDKVHQLELKIEQAGNPYKMTPVDFRIVQLVCAAALSVLLYAYGHLAGFGIEGAIALGTAGIAGGMYLPGYYIGMKMKQRKQTAVRELPDFLDLLSVSLEAGLGFDAALSRIVARQNGVLSVEFRRYLEELRLGLTRIEALEGAKRRLNTEDINRLISNIIQAEKLGVSLVQVLRIQSAFVREERKRRAEEKGMKAPIKIIFPLLFFIFPCLFIILLGPIVIQTIQLLGNH